MNKGFYIRLFGITITEKTCYMVAHFLLQVPGSEFGSFSLPESTAGFRPVMVATRVGVMLDLLDVEEIGSGRSDPPEGRSGSNNQTDSSGSSGASDRPDPIIFRVSQRLGPTRAKPGRVTGFHASHPMCIC